MPAVKQKLDKSFIGDAKSAAAQNKTPATQNSNSENKQNTKGPARKQSKKLINSAQAPNAENANTIPQEPKTEEANNSKKDSWLAKLLNTTWVKTVLPAIGNAAALVLNGISAYSNTFGVDKKFNKLASKLGSAGTKLYLITNGTINFLEQLLTKNYLLSIGNFCDNIVAAFVPQNQIYLARGIPQGLFSIANSLSILNGKNEFNSLEEHYDHIVSGLKKSVKLLFSKPLEAIASAKTGLLGTLSGALMILGFFTWKVTGSEKIGASLRDFGGLMMDLEMAKPHHLTGDKKRPFYFATGISYIFGTFCDYLSKFYPKHKDKLVPLGFFTDVIARNLLRVSQLKNELK